MKHWRILPGSQAGFYKGDKVTVKSSAKRILDRKQYRMIVCGQGVQWKRRTEQLSLENDRVIELKCIKNDQALKDLAGQLKELM